jgi:2-aminoethylphosphonate-pyruvate transaminase
MTPRTILLNPGPVTLSDRVRAALTRGDWCHREPEFAQLVKDINVALAGVHPALAVDYEAVLLTGSGTAAVEAMLATFAPDERRTLVIANGIYGERMARMLAAHGKPHRVLRHEWTNAVDVQALERVLGEDSTISHVASSHETTTALMRPPAGVCSCSTVSSTVAQECNLRRGAGTANKCRGAPASFVASWSAAPSRAGSILRPAHHRQHGDGFSPFTRCRTSLTRALAEHRELARRGAKPRAAVIGAALSDLGVSASARRILARACRAA